VPELSDAVLSPDSQLLATSSYDGTIQIWDINTSNLLETFIDLGRLHTVSWSPDGRQLAYSETNTEVNFIDVASVLSSLAETTPADSQIEYNLRNLLSAPNCSSSCWLGIQPNITTEAEVEAILSVQGIDYERQPLGRDGTRVFFYAILGGYHHLLVPENTLVVYTNSNNVTSINMSLQAVEINEIISEYGNPDQILEDGTSVRMIYQDESLVFGIISSDFNHAFNVYISSSEIIDTAYRYSWDDFEPCSDDNQLCAISNTRP
jgi:hypothetical protein